MLLESLVIGQVPHSLASRKCDFRLPQRSVFYTYILFVVVFPMHRFPFLLSARERLLLLLPASSRPIARRVRLLGHWKTAVGIGLGLLTVDAMQRGNSPPSTSGAFLPLPVPFPPCP